MLNDKFRFFFDDVTMDRGYLQKKINLKAYDIDFAVDLEKNPNASTLTLVGESNIDTISARKHQGKEFHYHCCIKISEEHFSQKAMKNDKKDDDNLDGILTD